MKTVIGNPLSNPPKKANSHVRGWALHWAETAKGGIEHKGSGATNEPCKYFFEHGVNFGGGLNLFGGLNDEVAQSVIKFVQLWNPQSELYSCDIDMPDYASMLRGRLGASSTSSMITENDINKFGLILEKAKTMRNCDLLGYKKVCIGDSHTAAFTASDSTGLRKNGQTLFGALKNNYLQESIDSLCRDIQVVTVCFGSIDIRHHICRQSDPKASVDKMLDSLLALTQKNNHLKFEVCGPVPVEYEGRRIPKTGFYKGDPFFGSREQRLDVTLYWIEGLKKRFENVVTVPESWYKMDGEAFAKEKMEFGGSVHLSPEVYRRFDWGVSEDTLDSLF